MPDGQSQTIKLEDYLGSYVLLVFYPGDFNPVSKTEILEFAEEYEKFKNNGCQVCGFIMYWFILCVKKTQDWIDL